MLRFRSGDASYKRAVYIVDLGPHFYWSMSHQFFRPDGTWLTRIINRKRLTQKEEPWLPW